MLSILADNVAATVANQTGVESNKTPFLPGRKASAHIELGGAVGTVPSIVIQSSPDNSVWTTVLTLNQLDGNKVGDVTLAKYMRVGVATAAGTTAGRYSAYLQTGD